MGGEVMGQPSLSTLRRWHRSLSALHRRAVSIGIQADELLGSDSQEAILINDPIIESHAALSCIEGMIDEREAA